MKNKLMAGITASLLVIATLIGVTQTASANQPPPPPRSSCTVLHGEFLPLMPCAPDAYTLRDSSGTYYPWQDWEGPVTVCVGDIIYAEFPSSAIRNTLWNAVWIFSYYANGDSEASYGKMPVGCNFATWKVTGACWWRVQLELVGGGVRLD